MSAGGFGPWREGIDSAERVARCRELRAICALVLGRKNSRTLVRLLRWGEQDDEILAKALKEFDCLPALPRRRILATLAELGAAQ